MSWNDCNMTIPAAQAPMSHEWGARLRRLQRLRGVVRKGKTRTP